MILIGLGVILAGTAQRAQRGEEEMWRRDAANWGAIAIHLRSASSSSEGTAVEIAQVVALAEEDLIRPLPAGDDLPLIVGGISNNALLYLRPVVSRQTVERGRLVQYLKKLEAAYALAADSAEARAEGRFYSDATRLELMRAGNDSATGP